MRYSRQWLFSMMLLPTLGTLCGMRAFAQDPPDIAMGMNPQATYHGGEFDFVDMGTGRLNLHIPLVVDHSQRGELNFTHSLTYTSTGTWQKVLSNNNWTTRPPKWGVVSPAVVTDGQLGYMDSEFYLDPDTRLRYNELSMGENGFALGPLHTLGSTSLGMESIDGSGIQWAGSIATNVAGIRFGSAFEDPNGNEITVAGSTTTDTLGRTWTTTSSDVSGCPTGGLVAPTTSSILTVPGPANASGGVRTFKLCYSPYNVFAQFNCNNAGSYSGMNNMLTGIVLPDGTTWRFDYSNNNDVDLTAVYPPTGGHISYGWTTYSPGCITRLRVITSRTIYDGANSYTWNYNITRGGTVTDPLGNDTVYTAGPAYEITRIQYYSGSKTSGTLLKTVDNSYQDLPNPYPGDVNTYAPDPQLLLTTTTTWANGQQIKSQLTYDSALTFTDRNPGGTTYATTYGLVTSETHTDYGNGAPGSALSTTSTNYVALTNSAYINANILNLPSSVIITDGSGNKCSETDYGYDETGRLVTYTGTLTQHTTAPNSVRGNLTSMTKQWSATPCKSGASWTSLPSTVYTVYDTGMRATMTDPRNNQTSYFYTYLPPGDSSCAPTANYYGAFVTQTTFPNTSSPSSANHIISGCYDANTGLLTRFFDQNNNETKYTYDVMLRPTNVTYPPDGGQTNFYYPNTKTVEMQKSIDGTRLTDSFAYYDGLGREIRRASANDEPAPYDQVDTCYDTDGRASFKTYPYQGSGGAPTTPFCSQPGDASPMIR